ncbi:hypothetical protein [Streptomyces sp. WMMC897]|uniref:hypothetical protein n=1 Tax=Streptomyces sp. WMMC897 TaxID=3014782 RepID=UPI0022B6CDCA|nr:hypothetical protein [Streptomyces sp. WMMC897]MCZ7413111.1 hypothetical protein [Streptomyces sp. WMMC897]MCZ7415505.1 hypothetical protein [Streptomyces sp. WMMC897]
MTAVTGPVQPALDGSVPPPARRQVDDFEDWITAVWPAYQDAADSGLPFTVAEIAEARRLPDPPNPQAHWGQLPGRLIRAGLITEHGTGKSLRPTVHKSRVAEWIGVPAHLRERAAAEAEGRAA